MNQEKSLVERLVSRIPTKEYYPTKHKKQAKKPARYVFISVQYYEKTDPETKVVSTHKIGFTYRKKN